MISINVSSTIFVNSIICLSLTFHVNSWKIQAKITFEKRNDFAGKILYWSYYSCKEHFSRCAKYNNKIKSISLNTLILTLCIRFLLSGGFLYFLVPSRWLNMFIGFLLLPRTRCRGGIHQIGRNTLTEVLSLTTPKFQALIPS